MKWSWASFLAYLGIMALLSFGAAYVASFIVQAGGFNLSESQETRLAMFLGSLSASLILAVVGAFRAWRLSHLLAAIAVVGALFGGNVSGATIILILASLVFLAANKAFQILSYYLPAAGGSEETDPEGD